MNKNAIQNMLWARSKLIEQIATRLSIWYHRKGYGDENVAAISGRVLTPEEKKQRHEFTEQIKTWVSASC